MSGAWYNIRIVMKSFSTAPTRRILDGLKRPDTKLKIIHIAGTNGKGSTAEFFTQILISANKKVGTFTSPEVYSFYDQFRIDGVPLDEETFSKYRQRVLPFAEGASEFEIQTATAILCFAEEGCEYAVIECGMGGLNDATNAVENKALAVITSVSLEHTAFLGKTVKEICVQKSGIIKNCPVIVNAHQSAEAREFFRGCKFADDVDEVFDGGFIYGGKKFELNAEGCCQHLNAACAIEGAIILGIDDGAVYKGVADCRPRGRLEKFYLNGREYILDGAHNPAAFEPLKEYLCSRGCKRTVIFGCLNDKDIDGNLKNLIADEIIAVPCDSPRSRALEDIYSHCVKQFGKKRVKRADGVADALSMADGGIIAVCGSFTLLKEAKNWIEKRI